MEPPLAGGSGASGTRLALLVAYDGSAFHGFAENVGVATVAGRLRAALERVLGHPVALTCAGRTDTGVHARGQVVSFDSDRAPDPASLRDSLNSMVGPEVVVRRVDTVDGDFDARFSARWRRYHYHLLTGEVPDPFLAATTWWVAAPLDLAAMDAAAQVLVGEHDFSSFCRRPRTGPCDPPASLVRRVHHARWTPPCDDGVARFEILASAFCHQMVRSIVGALVAVGRGRLDAAGLAALLAARDRRGAPNLAPPHGLVLDAVGYDDVVPPPGALAR